MAVLAQLGFATRESVAAMFGVDEQTIDRWERQGRLPAAKMLGRTVLFDLDAIRAKLKKQAGRKR